MHVILRIYGMILRSHRRQLAMGYVTALGASLVALAIPQMLGRGVDRVLTAEEGGLDLLLLLGLALVLVGVTRGLFAFGQTYIAESLSQLIAYELRNRYFDRLQHLSFAFHDAQGTGALMSRATADVEGVRMFVNMGAVRLSFMAAIVVGVVTAMLLTDVVMAAVSLAFIPFLAFRAVTTSLILRGMWMRVQEMTAEMVSALQENLTGIRVVKAFAADEHEKEKFRQRSKAVADQTFETQRTWSRNFVIMNFGFMLSIGAVLLVGGQRVMDSATVVDGQLLYSGFTPGDLASFFFYMMLLMMPVRMLGWTVNTFARAASSGERIFEILDAPSPVWEAPEAVDMGRVKGRVTFDHVSFSYDGYYPALRDVTVHVERGMTVALVGRPGSGKTTFAHLIPRFYDATEGQVLLDGVDVRQLTLASLRRNVGVVQQDVFIHTASIRDNVAYGNVEAPIDEVVEAARIAQLHDFVDEMPDAYETVVGERGIGLSGGQKQRLSIARTLLMDPPILLLDDSTSSVDVHTEQLLHQAMAGVVAERTTFMITNRFSTISHADLILVFKDGEIVQRGGHEELLAQGGEYLELYESQVRPHEAAPHLGRDGSNVEAAS